MGQCKSCRKIIDAASYLRNKERVSKRNKEWRKNNPDRTRELRKQWAKDNPDKARETKLAIDHRRRVRLRDNIGVNMSTRAMKELKDTATECFLCGLPFDSNKHTKSYEHIIPVFLGGTNAKENVMISGLNCNRSRVADGSDIETLQKLLLLELEFQIESSIVVIVKGK